MRIHHLNCGCDCPVGGALFDGRSTGPLGHLVCHCLLIETDAHGLVLVDTGYGLKDVAHPHGRHPRIPRTFRAMLNIRLREEDTAVRQLEALGFRVDDVRHIVLTHLDFDHAGGLEDFPHAAVHLLDDEWTAARQRPRGWVARQRYRFGQWDEVADWRRYPAGGGEPWFGFDAVRDLDRPAAGAPAGAAARAHLGSRRGWRSTRAPAGCCTPATRISTGARCAGPSAAAPRACAPTSA